MVGDLNVGEGMILIPIVVYCDTLISRGGGAGFNFNAEGKE